MSELLDDVIQKFVLPINFSTTEPLHHGISLVSLNQEHPLSRDVKLLCCNASAVLTAVIILCKPEIAQKETGAREFVICNMKPR